MIGFVAVAIGGAAGSVVRYAVSLAVSASSWGDSKVPWATFLVNVVGSFFLGGLVALALRPDLLPPPWRLAVSTGFCGALTTYSTFNVETLKLLEDGHWGLAAMNLGGTVAVCLVAGFLGLVAGRALFPAS